MPSLQGSSGGSSYTVEPGMSRGVSFRTQDEGEPTGVKILENIYLGQGATSQGPKPGDKIFGTPIGIKGTDGMSRDYIKVNHVEHEDPEDKISPLFSDPESDKFVFSKPVFIPMEYLQEPSKRARPPTPPPRPSSGGGKKRKSYKKKLKRRKYSRKKKYSRKR